MIQFFKKLFARGSPSPAKAEPAVEYDGFSITPCPRKVGGGWSTEAVIRKPVGGEPAGAEPAADAMKQHAFIRADISTTREAAIALIISKAKTLIDQQRDRIFD